MSGSRVSAARQIAIGLVVAALATGVCGCDGTLGADKASVGGGLPTLKAEEQVDGAVVDFTGVIQVLAEGCMRVRVDAPAGDTTARWIVWPEGAELYAPDTPDPTSALLGDELFSDQDQVTGTAQLVGLAQLPLGATPGSFFNGKGNYCRAQDTGVIVVRQVRHAE